MKTFYSKTVKGLRLACAALMLMAANSAFADDTTWDFTSLSTNDATNLAADTENWTSTGEGNGLYYYNATSVTGYKYNVSAADFLTADAKDGGKCFRHLYAGSTELERTKGLYFGIYYSKDSEIYSFGNGTDKIRIYNNGINLHGTGVAIGIDGLKAGYTVTIATKSSSNYLNVGYNLTATEGFTANSATNTATVDADGAVFFYASNGLLVYSITVKDTEGNVVTGISQPNTAVETETDNAIYNLQGQRMPSNDVDALPSGVYVVNGKKVIK